MGNFVDLRQATPFLGRLSLDADSVELSFNLSVNAAGEIQFEFPELPLTKKRPRCSDGAPEARLPKIRKRF
jgi:hypothetical protein